jgi:hypothetical protein
MDFGFHTAHDGQGVATPLLSDAGFVVWRWTDMPSALHDRVKRIDEARQNALQAGNQSPILVLLFDPSTAKQEELKWFSEQGVILLEDTAEIHEVLTDLKKQLASGDSFDYNQPPSGETNSHKVEHWAVDDHGYLVLATPNVNPPQKRETDPNRLYQAVLDCLNSPSSQPR